MQTHKIIILNDGTGGMQARMHQLANEIESITEIHILNTKRGDFFYEIYNQSNCTKKYLSTENITKTATRNYKLTVPSHEGYKGGLNEIRKILYDCSNNTKLVAAGNSTTIYMLLMRGVFRINVPIYFLFRNSLSEKTQWKRIIYKLIYAFLLKRNDAIVSISRGLQDEIKTLSRYVTRKVIYNGVPERPISKKYYKPNKLHCRLLVVARLELQKRVDLTIEATYRLKQLGYSISLDIYGDGDQRDMLSQQIKQNQLLKEVTMHGWVENIAIDW